MQFEMKQRHILQTYPKQMPLAVMLQCDSPDVMLITLLVNLGLMLTAQHNTRHMTRYGTHSHFQTMQSVSRRDHTATTAIYICVSSYSSPASNLLLMTKVSVQNCRQTDLYICAVQDLNGCVLQCRVMPGDVGSRITVVQHVSML
jgi:hypothetical protein